MVDIATDYIKDLNNAEFHINHNYKVIIINLK